MKDLEETFERRESTSTHISKQSLGTSVGKVRSVKRVSTGALASDADLWRQRELRRCSQRVLLHQEKLHLLIRLYLP